MSCIHYKFKSSLDYNSVTFDGLHLSLGDLKKAISAQKRLRQGEFELEIINAQTGDVYKKSDELIPKNTSVIVSRVPVTKSNTTSTQRSWEAFKQECAKVKQQERQKMLELEKIQKAAEATTVPASEMDKIKAVIDQSTKGFEPSSFQGRHPHSQPHEHYVCKRCGNKGHFITNCPNIKQEDRVIEPRVKRTTGIPSTMLTIVDDPLHPGALLTHHGQFAVPTVDVAGYRDSKKDQLPFSEENKEPVVEKKIIPTELLCHICEDLCVDAAIAPCCGTSFCDECLREELLESEDHQCPSCHETNVSPDRIVANRSMRIAVNNFLNDTGYSKVKRRRSSSTSGELSSILPQSLRPASPPPPGPVSQPIKGPSTPPPLDSPTLAAPTESSSITSLVCAVPSTAAIMDKAPDDREEDREPYHSRLHREGHSSSYKPWLRHEPRFERPPNNVGWNGSVPVSSHHPAPFNPAGPPPRIMAAAAAAVASQAMRALVGSGLRPPHMGHPPFPGPLGFPLQGPPPGRDMRHPTSPMKKKTVDVFDSFADFTRKRSRTPELKSRSRSLSASPLRRSSHSYSPAKKGSQGRSPRRSSRSHSRSRTGSFQRSRSRGRSPKRSRSKSPPRRRRSGSAESRGLSELRSLSPEPVSKRSKSRSRTPRKLYRSRSRSRSTSFKGTYRSSRSRSRSLSKSKKLKRRSYSPLSPRGLRSPNRSPIRRSPGRSPRRSPARSPARSPRRSPYRSPGRSPLYSPVRSRLRRSFSPRRRSRSFSPRKRSPARSKSRSPFSKRRPYGRSRTPSPSRRRSRSPYKSNRRSPSPYRKVRSPSPYRGGRGRDSKYPRDDRDRPGGPNRAYSPSRRSGGGPPPSQNPNLPPPPVLPNMALPPPEEYFKHNPAGYEEFLRTFYAQIGNQSAPWGGGGPPPPGEFHHPQHPQHPPGPPIGNSYPPGGPPGPPNGPPPHHPHHPPGFPMQDRRQPPWDPAGPGSNQRPRSMSPKFGDRFRRDGGRPGFDNRGGGGRDKDRRFDRFGERNINRRGGDYSRVEDQRQDDGRHDQRYEDRDRKWRADHRDKRADDGKDKKVVHSEIRDKRSARDSDKRSRGGDKTKSTERSKDSGKSKERVSIEKKKSPQHSTKSNEKTRKGEERKKKEENAVVTGKSVDDKNSDIQKEETKSKTVEKHEKDELETKNDSINDNGETTEEHIPETKEDNNNETSQAPVDKEKKVAGKKKVGAAGKKLKAKGANAVDGEKKEKKTKKKKLTFGASETDAKGLKKKKLKRVVDYKSENTPTTEDVTTDAEKGNLSEPSPVKRAKVEPNDTEGLSTEKMEVCDDVKLKPLVNDHIPPTDTQKSPDRAMPEDEEEEMSSSLQTTKNDMITELPELSKWEREEDFDIPVVEKADQKPKGKPISLPRSVVDKAEMFLAGKPMKNSVVAAPVASGDNDKPEIYKDLTDKHKDVQSKTKNVLIKEKHREAVAKDRPKEREAFEKRDERYKGVSDRRRNSQDERREDVSDRRREDVPDMRREDVSDRRREDVQDRRREDVSDRRREDVPDRRREDVSDRRREDVSDRRREDVSDRRREDVSDRRREDLSDRRREDVSDRRREDVSDRRREDVSDRRKDYRDHRSKSPLHNSRDYSSNGRFANSKDFRSKSPGYNKEYRSKSPVHNKDYRSRSPVHNKDYRSKSPIRNTDYRSKSPIRNTDYRSKSPIRNTDYRHRSKSPIHASKDHKSKSPSERSRKVSIDSKKDQRERKGYDIQITVKGDRDGKHSSKKIASPSGANSHSQHYQDRGGNASEEDERSVVRSHSLERDVKSKSHKKGKESSKRKGEKASSSKSKQKKAKADSEEKDNADGESSASNIHNAKDDIGGPHRSPRDLRHKLEERSKAQNRSQSNSSGGGSYQKKLSVMDESEFVPDYEDAPEASNADDGEEIDKLDSASPGKNSLKENETSDENSSEEEGMKETKKHKKSKKKHKRKEKKEKKEKHKHKKKKHKKNKEKEDDE